MLNSTSIKSRFIVSLISNTIRSILGFFSGLLIARELNPSGYGDISFLLGSFVAISALLDMGSSSAFYTFISQRTQGMRFYLYYFAWLALQFIIPTFLITALLPESMIAKIWLGHSREIILLAFAASFMQQQVWQTLNQIGESSRKTIRVQIIGLVVAIGHLIMIYALLAEGLLTIQYVFWLLIVEYALATLWAVRFLREKQGAAEAKKSEAFSAGAMMKEYFAYCKPLALVSLITFLFQFVDRWLLQRFGGSSQQGYYQIAYQFAAVSLLATSSILNVFWKEIAEANAHRDRERLAALYQKVSRALAMLGAVLSGFLIPWTEQIVTVVLGLSYLTAVPVLMIMFLYPIHQSMGQIGGTMLLAGGHTKAYMTLSVTVMLISLPLSYLVQAPPHGTPIPGLGLGAIGMALKMVAVNIVSVNILAWIIARNYDWKFDWIYQIAGISLALGAGFLSKLTVGFFWNITRQDIVGLLTPFLASGILYVIIVSACTLAMPWLIGLEKKDMKSLIDNFKATISFR